MPAETSRAIFAFFTIIRMRENTPIFENKEAFFTDSVESVPVLGSVVLTVCLDLEGPIQEDSIILDHFSAHFCDSSS